MKRVRIVCLVFATAMLASCGGGSSPKNINSVYVGQLNDSGQTPIFAMSASLAQASGSGVNITGFNIGSLGNFPACFSSSTTQTATFTASGSSNGYVTGTFEMTISTVLTASNNVLTLTGNRMGTGAISGMWVLTGQAGCSGSGAFSLSPPPPV